MLIVGMFQVLQIISEAVLSGAPRPFATFEQFVRRGASGLLLQLLRPRVSSLRVSQRWLDEHEAAAVQRPHE